MRDAIVIGSGISGMVTAVKLAEEGVSVLLVSPFPSERSQSVMAAGGINAVLTDCEPAILRIRSKADATLQAGTPLQGSARAPKR